LDPKEEVVILSHPALVALANLARADLENVRVVLFYLCPTVIRSYFNKLALGGPITLPSNFPKALRRILYFLIDTLCLDIGVITGINEERKKLRLAPISHYFPHLQNAADLYVTLFPEWYSSTKPDYPQPLINGNFVAYSSPKELGSDDLAHFLDAGAPPILFTAGTGNKHAQKFFEVSLDVVNKMGTRALFLTKFRQQLPRDLPESVVWQEHISFASVLPRVATVVHHGGIGTVAASCQAGTPQIVVPSAYDQFDNGVIVRDLGIGQAIPMQSLTSGRLVKKLSDVMGSRSVKERCTDIAANFRSGADVSQILDRMLAVI
jgi:rhamnosyltransferase subunit B